MKLLKNATVVALSLFFCAFASMAKAQIAYQLVPVGVQQDSYVATLTLLWHTCYSTNQQSTRSNRYSCLSGLTQEAWNTLRRKRQPPVAMDEDEWDKLRRCDTPPTDGSLTFSADWMSRGRYTSFGPNAVNGITFPSRPGYYAVGSVAADGNELNLGKNRELLDFAVQYSTDSGPYGPLMKADMAPEGQFICIPTGSVDQGLHHVSIRVQISMGHKRVMLFQLICLASAPNKQAQGLGSIISIERPESFVPDTPAGIGAWQLRECSMKTTGSPDNFVGGAVSVYGNDTLTDLSAEHARQVALGQQAVAAAIQSVQPLPKAPPAQGDSRGHGEDTQDNGSIELTPQEKALLAGSPAPDTHRVETPRPAHHTNKRLVRATDSNGNPLPWTKSFDWRKGEATFGGATERVTIYIDDENDDAGRAHSFTFNRQEIRYTRTYTLDSEDDCWTSTRLTRGTIYIVYYDSVGRAMAHNSYEVNR